MSATTSKTTTRHRSSLSTTVPTSSTLTGQSNKRAADSTTSSPPPDPAATSSATSPTGTDGSAEIPREKVGVQPIYIREGGSIPTIRFLEKEFSAPAANLPCGQASDNAHLYNERLRVENLYKSREIFSYVFSRLPVKA